MTVMALEEEKNEKKNGVPGDIVKLISAFVNIPREWGKPSEMKP